MQGCGKQENASSFNDGSKLNIDILALGKADCSILYDGPYVVVIDTGTEDTASSVCSALQKITDHIDLLLLTHYDQDHIGGASEILKRFQVQKIIMPDMTPENPSSSEYVSLQSALENFTGNREFISDNLDLQFDDLSLHIEGAHGKEYKTDPDNNSSLVTHVLHCNHSFYFAGDVERQRIKDLLNDGVPTCDVLKFPHHGEHNKKTDDFLAALSPKYAVITCANSWSPEEKAFRDLEAQGCQVFLTSKGTVHIVSTENSLTVSQ